MEHVYGRYYAGGRAKEPDCRTCVNREECDRAQDGHFCPRWQSEAPKDRGLDPAEKWARGEDM